MNRRLTVLFLAALAGPALHAPARAADPDPKLAGQAREVLQKYCGKCHGPAGTNEGGINYILDVKKLQEKKKIVAGDPARSKLLKKVVAGEMPPEDEKFRPGKEEISLLERWIQAGAPADDAAAARSARVLKGEKDTLLAIRDHLNRLPRQDRPFQRYFTLTHLHSNPNVKEADLRLYRAALAKLVNHLSWKSDLVVPAPLDPEGTVFAVDLRQLDWDRLDLWRQIVRVYPYGLKHDRDPDEALQELAREVYDKAGTDLPYVRADWFVATASRPPLYHTLLYDTLLELPSSMKATDLEKKLNVDVAQNFLRDQLTRAGFTSSGVSSQNRLVERHAAATGAYWKSYDFKTNEGTGNLFRFPLGPAFKGNPFPKLAFEQAGGEIIFNLPNGLQGYLLVNDKDERIDEGPIEVVSDSLKTAGKATVVNGLSCMACHNVGMKSEFRDTVRDGCSAVGEPRDKVRRLYPRKEEMDRLLKKDEDRFLRAVEEATGPFLKVGGDKDKNIRDFAEPVGVIARLYLLKEVGPEEAAYELGLASPGRLQGAIQANDLLRQLGLGPLAQGATIKRETWESLQGFNSPFQEAASALDLGTPKRVK
jgi:mono/diheme cytochrome c family protein